MACGSSKFEEGEEAHEDDEQVRDACAGEPDDGGSHCRGREMFTGEGTIERCRCTEGSQFIVDDGLSCSRWW